MGLPLAGGVRLKAGLPLAGGTPPPRRPAPLAGRALLRVADRAGDVPPFLPVSGIAPAARPVRG
ncbi:hypothetical protein Sdia_34030 [Streptomyces diastaticus subsp. diastaticus]|uniref:Uncharacterized protein n=1 Tax=Streptomyces diastaticus subsp. diastaticus TaxID=68040 RepID=A0ABQ1CR80_STRDI|nr:hypothetical protein Sdia_34030 [Streptomyces diastaticus subsp. diastaticus]GGU23722.1 hypothetical protein GCM10015534_28200 [Streptomyces diastaticus subsp. diastaticus]